MENTFAGIVQERITSSPLDFSLCKHSELRNLWNNREKNFLNGHHRGKINWNLLKDSWRSWAAQEGNLHTSHVPVVRRFPGSVGQNYWLHVTSHCTREGGLAINHDRCCSLDLWLSLEERRLVFSSRNQCPALHKGGALFTPIACRERGFEHGKIHSWARGQNMACVLLSLQNRV